MSEFPGRRIVPAGDSFDWYMNPEGHAYSDSTEPAPTCPGLVTVAGQYDGSHAVYPGLLTRFSLADIVLFHPDVTDTMLAPYLVGAQRLIKQLPADMSISAECAQRTAQLLSSTDPISLDACSNLRHWLTRFSEGSRLPVKSDTVAIGLGRLLVSKTACYVLLPMGLTASGYATLCRLVEELLMIAVLFDDKRPHASACARRLAAELIGFGRDMYGISLCEGIEVSLLAHLVRRAEAPHAPPELPAMMERVAAEVNRMESASR